MLIRYIKEVKGRESSCAGSVLHIDGTNRRPYHSRTEMIVLRKSHSWLGGIYPEVGQVRVINIGLLQETKSAKRPQGFFRNKIAKVRCLYVCGWRTRVP